MPWITNRNSTFDTHTRNKLYKAYLTNSTIHNKNKYKTYQNKLTNIIQNFPKIYYSGKVDRVKSNMKSTWGIINDLIGKKRKKIAQ